MASRTRKSLTNVSPEDIIYASPFVYFGSDLAMTVVGSHWMHGVRQVANAGLWVVAGAVGLYVAACEAEVEGYAHGRWMWWAVWGVVDDVVDDLFGV